MEEEAQSNRMCYTSNNGAQSKRMSLIGEGIECLVTKSLQTRYCISPVNLIHFVV